MSKIGEKIAVEVASLEKAQKTREAVKKVSENAAGFNKVSRAMKNTSS